jgi:uncharacterized protein YndB with AHSA1/START domain
MSYADTLQVSTPNDLEIVLTREFAAPTHLVFDAMANPELVKRWLWGPPGWTMTECTGEAVVGGEFRNVWRSAEGTELTMRGVYRDVVPGERLVRTECFEFGPENQLGEQLAMLVLAEQDGHTALTITLSYPAKEARDATLASGMERGAAASYDRMEELLASGVGC